MKPCSHMNHIHQVAPHTRACEECLKMGDTWVEPGENARRQMSGFGGMVSFELEGSIEEVSRFASSRRYFALGESLGGVKSLVCHPATMTHASIPAAARAELGLSDSLIRLSPGCENAKDLVEDLQAGLALLASERGNCKAQAVHAG